MNEDKRNRIEAFLKELEELCNKHGVALFGNIDDIYVVSKDNIDDSLGEHKYTYANIYGMFPSASIFIFDAALGTWVRPGILEPDKK